MERITIKVRKEVIKCKKCEQSSPFFYLSDFAYGQRLVFFKKKEIVAYINLIEDPIFPKYVSLIEKILQKKNVQCSRETLDHFINTSFGMTCDRIEGMRVDFSQQQEVCPYCGSVHFNRNMEEPEEVIDLSVYKILHDKWEGLLVKQQEERIIEALVKEGLL